MIELTLLKVCDARKSEIVSNMIKLKNKELNMKLAFKVPNHIMKVKMVHPRRKIAIAGRKSRSNPLSRYASFTPKPARDLDHGPGEPESAVR